MKRTTRIPYGFTLIELLIVVAIIAILAAIAVPNFLEAQTRSKVSRVKADQRSLATGIESYFVDNNVYPLGWPGDPAQFQIRWGMMQISTPIAYVTDGFPVDPFIPVQSGKIKTGSGGSFNVVGPWDLSYQFSQRLATGAGTSGLSTSAGRGSWWLLRGYGPDQDADAYSTPIANNDVPGVINKVYDPTNGTVSDGNVYRLGGAASNEAGRSVQNSMK
jgi:prepilin-type N-terminal cleavage/methylation domain-containing protein